ncbi:FxSxx-COOH cyclophane-containing RiPP peptide [Streptomyces sp. NPDC087917]|uniref:FxSxx-COOH cyclophane-containing RiPP peptide n=1 Tax=unclassified Streptomyces TaxID=2593676 RepID=UPI00341D39EA
MVTGRQEVARPTARTSPPVDPAASVDPSGARPCPGRLPDLSGLDLAALRGIDHPVLAEIIAGMVERVTHPAEILNAFDSGVA